MPLLDHFNPPLSQRRRWESFHSAWAEALARLLNQGLLPARYYAEVHVKVGSRVEVDTGTFEEANGAAPDGGGVAVWAPPRPSAVVPLSFTPPDVFEVQVLSDEEGPRLVAAVELVSPANKDRPAHRQAFAIKCASYLSQGISLIVIDIVTTRQANLHNEMMRLLGHGDTFALAAGTELYAVAYRPVVRQQVEEFDVWPAALALGQRLPVLPLALTAELAVPLDLEATYTAACQRRRLS